MSAETLRKAAELMRERAELAADSAHGEPWYPAEELHDLIGGGSRNTADAQHIASWPPAVAEQVAIWLEKTAAGIERRGVTARITPAENAAIAVAHTYLGESA